MNLIFPGIFVGNSIAHLAENGRNDRRNKRRRTVSPVLGGPLVTLGQHLHHLPYPHLEYKYRPIGGV